MICEQNVKKFCKDYTKIENYEKAISDTTQTWHCHHRMEAVYTRTELIKYGLYYDREPHQLIFLTDFEHKALHKKSEETKAKMSAAHKGKKFSDEHKAKIGAASKGRKTMLGKKRSEETKAKISAAHKGRTSPKKGKHWKLVDGHRVWY